jgi:hypothetical protein
MISNKEIPAIFLALVMMLGGLTVISTAAAPANVQGQNPFEISTEQSDQQATITIKLATNNTVVIPPNGTVIEVPGNITQVDNDTVVIAPANETVTPLPGNVTVITPPEPEPCGCPPPPVEEQPVEIPDVIITPAPGQNVTTELPVIIIDNATTEEPAPVPPGNETGNETGGPVILPTPEPTPSNETADGNDTALAPAALSQMLPWWQA